MNDTITTPSQALIESHSRTAEATRDAIAEVNDSLSRGFTVMTICVTNYAVERAINDALRRAGWVPTWAPPRIEDMAIRGLSIDRAPTNKETS